MQAAAQDDDAEGEGWVAKNQDLVRASPLIAGSLGIVSVILNRSFSGVSRHQSKAVGVPHLYQEVFILAKCKALPLSFLY